LVFRKKGLIVNSYDKELKLPPRKGTAGPGRTGYPQMMIITYNEAATLEQQQSSQG
jgi:hypothetical protein